MIQRNAWKIKKKVMSFDEFYSVFHINPKPGNPIPLGAGRKGFFLQKNKKYFIKIWLLTLVTSVMQIQKPFFSYEKKEWSFFCHTISRNCIYDSIVSEYIYRIR